MFLVMYVGGKTMKTCREMIQTNFRYSPYAEDGRGLSVYHHLCLNIFMLKEYGGWDKEAAC